jgi:hypothetical protein
MGEPERACIAAQTGKAFEQGLVRRAREQRREQRVFLRACELDIIQVAGRAGFAGKGWSNDSTVNPDFGAQIEP